MKESDSLYLLLPLAETDSLYLLLYHLLKAVSGFLIKKKRKKERKNALLLFYLLNSYKIFFFAIPHGWNVPLCFGLYV